MNNFKMQLSQLQALIQNCKQLFTQIEKHDPIEVKRRQVAELKKRIRQRRVEIIQLKYEIKRNKLVKQQIQEMERANLLIANEIKNESSLNTKQLSSYQKVIEMAIDMEQKIKAFDSKIIKIKAITESDPTKKEYLRCNQFNQELYQMLLEDLKFKMQQKASEDQQFRSDFRQNERKATIISNLVAYIDQKYAQLCKKIDIQKGFIDDIKQPQLQHIFQMQRRPKFKTEGDQFEPNQTIFFSNKNKLKSFQQNQIKSLFMKPADRIEQKKGILGRIVKQNIKVPPFVGRITNNGQRQTQNFTNFSKYHQSEAKNQFLDTNKSTGYFLSSDRLSELETNKRIRTHQTQMKKYSHQFRNVVLKEFSQKSKFEPVPEQSILDIYLQMKQKSTPKKIDNIEIFNIVKITKKNKFSKNERG